MEATGEDKLGLLQTILPPNLEDAGLEDCALPPDSIHLAFLKAASAVSSRAASLLSPSSDHHGGCVTDPDVGPNPGPCAAEKGGAWMGGGEGARDVVVGELNEGDTKKTDEVVVIGEGIKEIEKEVEVDGEEEEEEEDEKKKKKKPTLVEGYFMNP